MHIVNNKHYNHSWLTVNMGTVYTSRLLKFNIA